MDYRGLDAKQLEAEQRFRDDVIREGARLRIQVDQNTERLEDCERRLEDMKARQDRRDSVCPLVEAIKPELHANTAWRIECQAVNTAERRWMQFLWPVLWAALGGVFSFLLRMAILHSHEGVPVK